MLCLEVEQRDLSGWSGHGHRKLCVRRTNDYSDAILRKISRTLEWRNWQTHGTQNPASFTGYEGSTPSSSTIENLGGSLFGRQPSKQEEVPAAERATIRQQDPVEIFLDEVSDADASEVNRTAIWTAW